MGVLNEILIERHRQIEKGFGADHDDQHVNDELPESAAYLAMPGKFVATDTVLACASHAMTKHPRRQCLIIAAAMLVAEVERLDRANGRGESPIPEGPSRQFFLQNLDAGECPFWLGGEHDLDEAAMAVRHHFRPEFDEMLIGEADSIDFQLTVKSMTRAEVEALPDM